jgi:microcystin-dependent protein
MSSGTSTPADGLMVYDSDHHMHYQYNSSTARWNSLTPFILSTAAVSSITIPAGTITTPNSPSTFSVGINKQNPVQALDVAGNSTVSGNSQVGGNLSVNGSLNVAGFAVNALMPSGAIIMFHGATIPSGWVICNGQNGTPDLRGRFIVASGTASTAAIPGDLNYTYTTNQTGGENRHTLTKGEIPKHRHAANADGSDINISNGGSHNHNVTPHGQGLDQQRSGGTSGGLASDATATINTSNNTHSHSTSEFGGQVGDGSLDGVGGFSHENRPQFYVLTFIMKQ